MCFFIQFHLEPSPFRPSKCENGTEFNGFNGETVCWLDILMNTKARSPIITLDIRYVERFFTVAKKVLKREKGALQYQKYSPVTDIL